MDEGEKRKSKYRQSNLIIWRIFFKLWDVFTTREMIAYLISGVLTTAVKLVLYWL